MSTIMQKIKEIEDMMARTQKNKATTLHLGLLKAKLAKLYEGTFLHHLPYQRWWWRRF